MLPFFHSVSSERRWKESKYRVLTFPERTRPGNRATLLSYALPVCVSVLHCLRLLGHIISRTWFVSLTLSLCRFVCLTVLHSVSVSLYVCFTPRLLDTLYLFVCFIFSLSLSPCSWFVYLPHTVSIRLLKTIHLFNLHTRYLFISHCLCLLVTHAAPNLRISILLLISFIVCLSLYTHLCFCLSLPSLCIWVCICICSVFINPYSRADKSRLK